MLIEKRGASAIVCRCTVSGLAVIRRDLVPLQNAVRDKIVVQHPSERRTIGVANQFFGVPESLSDVGHLKILVIQTHIQIPRFHNFVIGELATGKI